MSRSSGYNYDPETGKAQKTSACGTCLRYTWKTITFTFSHVTLVSMVVSYCILGAVTFQHLEEENEKEVKRNISKIRFNLTDELWKLTTGLKVLKEDDYTEGVIVRLKDFEVALLKAITKDGWDGDEDIKNVQWSFPGSLFYSIIIITTIGYGHIAPKTTWGKIVTIFYAILGIPLMLLCLSNIGDIMATSFRFLYWKVCCYICTRKPSRRNRRGRSSRATVRQRNGRSRTSSIKRSVRHSTRSADSGFAFSHSQSDTELRSYDDRFLHVGYKRGQSLPRMKMPHHQEDEFRHLRPSRVREVPTSGSLDRRKFNRNNLVDPTLMSNIRIVTNRYVVDESELQGHLPGITVDERAPQPRIPRLNAPISSRRQYVDDFDAGAYPNVLDDMVHPMKPRNHLELPRDMSPSETSIRGSDDRSQRRRRQNFSGPKIMSPFGYGHQTKYLDNPESDLDYYSDTSANDPRNQSTKPVPIWLCVFLVISYIVAGTFLFNYWEGWDHLDAAYFCFITLTTIGFGDFVPAKRVKDEEFKKNIAFCSLYLLFGISLLAMSFNLVQEEVIANVKRVAKKLGIIKSEADEEEEDDDDDDEADD